MEEDMGGKTPEGKREYALAYYHKHRKEILKKAKEDRAARRIRTGNNHADTLGESAPMGT